MKKESIKKLVEIANALDTKGLISEASEIDKILKQVSMKRKAEGFMEVPVPGFEGFTLRYMSDPKVLGDSLRDKASFEEVQPVQLVNNPSIGLFYKGKGSLSSESTSFGMFIGEKNDVPVFALIKEGKDNEAYMLLLNNIAKYVAEDKMPTNIRLLIEYGTCVSGEPGLLSDEDKRELSARYKVV